MATNIEIKARVPDLEALRKKVLTLADRPAEVLYQEDVFFHIPRGRLKLRYQGGHSGQLIYYERSDLAGPKASQYVIYSSGSPDDLRALLRASLGERGLVRKTRWLYLVGNTRIHLDEVEGLGSFMELEVVLGRGETAEEGRAKARDLCKRLGIKTSALIQGAYLDLIEANMAEPFGGSGRDCS